MSTTSIPQSPTSPTPQRPTTTPRRRQCRAKPNLAPLVTRLTHPLAPLHPLPAGDPHPAFPVTILSYHLLTESQCDSLAKYYHQWVESPTVWTWGYPTIMDWDAEFFRHVREVRGNEAVLDIKRRKVGRFIGLRGCETPVEESEERERWWRRREEMRVKSDTGGFWRRGWGEW